MGHLCVSRVHVIGDVALLNFPQNRHEYHFFFLHSLLLFIKGILGYFLNVNTFRQLLISYLDLRSDVNYRMVWT